MDIDLNTLLDRLHAGDEDAAAELFCRYANYARIVVRRRMTRRHRARFDTSDVLQSVWIGLIRDLRGKGLHFDTPEQFRGFLALVARNRFLNRLRHDRQSLTEEPLPSAALASPQPRPSEVAEANDLWQALLQLCPAEHRLLLRLKREGLTTDEVARRVGLHPSSVRRILYDLARRLARAT